MEHAASILLIKVIKSKIFHSVFLQKILSTLRSVTENRTSLFIAHRLSTVVDSDAIVVLENGRVRERGTHHTLIEDKNTLYSYLWHKQNELQLSDEQSNEKDSKNESNGSKKNKYDFPVPEAMST